MVCSKRFVLRGVLGLGVTIAAAAQVSAQDSPPAAKPPSGDPAAAAAATAGPADPVRAALQKTPQLDIIDTPLTDLVGLLEKQHGIQIQIERKALEDAGVAVDTPVTISIQGVTLGSALRHVLGQQGLTWAVSKGVLVITTPEEAEQSYVDTRVYAVASLVAPTDRRLDASESANTLMDLIVTTVAPDSWDEVGGPGSIVYRDGALAVSQTEEVHQQLAGLLAALNQARAEHAPRVIALPGASPAAQHALQAIDEALAQPTEFEFTDIPLADVALKISRDRKIPVLLDVKALEDAGVAVDTPVTASLHGLPLRTALEFLLKQNDLTWTIRDEALVITTQEEAEQSDLQLQVFSVADLLHTATPGAEEHSADQLIDAVVNTVAPDSWDEVGGPGRLRPEFGTRTLVCLQTPQTLADVAALLEELARARAAQPVAAEWSDADDERMELKVYKLPSGLQARDGKAVSVPVADAEAVSQMIMDLAAPDSWQSGRAYIRPLGDRLVVRHTRRVLRDVEQLLSQLEWATPTSVKASGPQSGVHVGPPF
ncbi:MAG: hypothetical protein U0836_09750 [Pirellulales bacterium]